MSTFVPSRSVRRIYSVPARARGGGGRELKIKHDIRCLPRDSILGNVRPVGVARDDETEFRRTRLRFARRKRHITELNSLGVGATSYVCESRLRGPPRSRCLPCNRDGGSRIGHPSISGFMQPRARPARFYRRRGALALCRLSTRGRVERERTPSSPLVLGVSLRDHPSLPALPYFTAALYTPADDARVQRGEAPDEEGK